jgi:hypothetical protein
MDEQRDVEQVRQLMCGGGSFCNRSVKLRAAKETERRMCKHAIESLRYRCAGTAFGYENMLVRQVNGWLISN